jgi:hypothetical protein
MTEEPEHTPRIACLAWGSLVWDTRQLPIRREWFKDGPFVSVEFTRQSEDGRITLVIDPRAEPVRVLWAHMLSSSLADAQKALRDREGITATNWLPRIGSWRSGHPPPRDIPELPQWAEARDLDAVVWTALPPSFNGETRSPSLQEVIEYLRVLSDDKLARARDYIERAPQQINTAFRRRIEAALGWPCRADF